LPVQSKKKILVLGLGNPFLSDDSAGWRVAEELQQRINRPNITIRKSSFGGLDVLELLIGYDSTIIIDAIKTESGKAGSIYRFSLDYLQLSKCTAYAHNVSLAAALEFGKKQGLALPEYIRIFAIEVIEIDAFSEKLSPEVASAIPVCVGMIAGELN
jgi:hydrogenase maturation protease